MTAGALRPPHHLAFGPLAQGSGRVSLVVRRMFMCQFIKWLAADAGEPFPFGQPDMPILRLQMVHELRNSEIQLPP